MVWGGTKAQTLWLHPDSRLRVGGDGGWGQGGTWEEGVLDGGGAGQLVSGLRTSAGHGLAGPDNTRGLVRTLLLAPPAAVHPVSKAACGGAGEPGRLVEDAREVYLQWPRLGRGGEEAREVRDLLWRSPGCQTLCCGICICPLRWLLQSPLVIIIIMIIINNSSPVAHAEPRLAGLKATPVNPQDCFGNQGLHYHPFPKEEEEAASG